MPKMKPIQEWICDSCGQTVTPENGYLEWLSPDSGPHSFNVVHNKQRCFQHDNHFDRSDNPLDVFLGAKGLQQFLAMLDLGRVLDPVGRHMPGTPELRSFVDVIRRLHIPYYEEARLYFEAAVSEGYFSDQNEVSIFVPETCKAIIERYENT